MRIVGTAVLTIVRATPVLDRSNCRVDAGPGTRTQKRRKVVRELSDCTKSRFHPRTTKRSSKVAILAGGTFDYRVVMRRDAVSQHRWFGEGRSMRDSRIHPGMFGKLPAFELENGRLSLRATESKFSLLINSHYRRQQPSQPLSFEVGRAPAAVLDQHDQLFFHRFGTGDYALTIRREESLKLAIGSCTELSLGNEIQVEEDPRIAELDLNDLAEEFDRMVDPESQVIWIDVAKGDLDAQIGQIERAPRCEHLIVLFREMSSEPGSSGIPSTYYDRLPNTSNAECVSYRLVGARFPDKRSWIDYVKQHPRGRPTDLHLSFQTGDEGIKLCEGEEAFIGAYYVRVDRVYRDGIPGELSSLAMARMNSELTKEMVIESAGLILKRCHRKGR